jgi:hypothetical protein
MYREHLARNSSLYKRMNVLVQTGNYELYNLLDSTRRLVAIDSDVPVLLARFDRMQLPSIVVMNVMYSLYNVPAGKIASIALFDIRS